MKKVFTIILVCFAALSVNAQLYTNIRHFDKFDDLIKEETHKTLITKTDSTFIIEEKGRKPKVYLIINAYDKGTIGSKDNVVNLVNNVYGYQETWSVIRYEDKEIFNNTSDKVLKGELKLEELAKYWLFITHRVISRYEHVFHYESEYFWVENEEPTNNLIGNNVNRIVYSNR